MTENRWGTAADAALAENKTRLRATALATEGKPPEAYAAAARLADEHGWPVEAVVDAPADFEAEAHRRRLDRLGQENPKVAEFLTTPAHMALAQDDIEDMDAIGRLLLPLNSVPHAAINPQRRERLWTRLKASSNALIGGVQQATGEAVAGLTNPLRDYFTGFGRFAGPAAPRVAAVADTLSAPERLAERGASLSGYAAEERARASEGIVRPDSIAAALTDPINATDYYLGMAADSAVPMAATVGATVAGGPVAGSAVMGASTAAPAYARFRAEGETQGRAARAALAEGVIEAIFERLPLAEAFAPARAFASRLFRTGAAEGATEVATSLAQDTSEAVLLDRPLDPGQMFDNAVDAGIVGAGMGASMAVPGAVAAESRARSARRTEELAGLLSGLERSTHDAIRLSQLTEIAARLKLGERDPKIAEAFARHVGGDEQQVYIPAADFRTLFQEGDAAEQAASLSGNPDALAEAGETGDIVIPLAKYVSVVARLPNAEAIAHVARMTADGYSRRDIEGTDFDAEIAAIEGETQQGDEAASSLETIKTGVFTALQQTGRYKDNDAELMASLLARTINTFARRTGQDPGELMQRYQLRINGQSTYNGRPAGDRDDASQGTDARPVPGDAGGAGAVRGGAGDVAQPGGPDQLDGRVLSALAQREPDGSLRGLPRLASPGGEPAGFFADADRVARRYVEARGEQYAPPSTYAPLDADRGARIAAEFEAMAHDPANPEVAAAYRAMIDESAEQFRAMVASGITVEVITADESGELVDPYAGNPRALFDDLRNNKHLWVFSTADGFGSDASFDPANNPLLEATEFADANGVPLLANDVFRAVHDYFGHAKEGIGFRAEGEENAWRAHSAMYSPLARRAMTTETRGQNSWVNFGPAGDTNRTASVADTVYADQKIGLLPEWVSEEGREDGVSLSQGSPKAQTDTPEFKAWFGRSMMKGDLDTGDGSEPIVFYHGTYAEDDFQFFDRYGTGSRQRARTFNALGSWFADTPENANIWAGADKGSVDSILARNDTDLEGRPASRVIPAYLKVTSPLYVTIDELRNLWQTHAKGNARFADGNPELLLAWMRTMGYDGIVLDARDVDSDMMEPGHYVVVPEPEQIKSAIANSGAFDPGQRNFLLQSDATPAEQFFDALDAITTPNPFGGGESVFMHENGGAFGAVAVTRDLGRRPDVVHLDTVRSFAPGSGHGNYVLRRTLELADKFGVTIELSAIPFGDKPMKKRELIAWYKRNGFEGKGERLVRKPQPQGQIMFQADGTREAPVETAARNDLGLYSAVEQAVIDMKLPGWKTEDGTMPGAEVWSKLTKAAGVKAEELVWLGLEEYLTLPNSSRAGWEAKEVAGSESFERFDDGRVVGNVWMHDYVVTAPNGQQIGDRFRAKSESAAIGDARTYAIENGIELPKPKPPRFTRGEVLEFVRNNGVRVVETLADQEEQESEGGEFYWDRSTDTDSSNWEGRAEDFMYDFDRDENTEWWWDWDKWVGNNLPEIAEGFGIDPERLDDVGDRDDLETALGDAFDYDKLAELARSDAEARAEAAAESEYMDDPVYVWYDSETEITITGNDDRGYYASSRNGDEIASDIYSFSEAELQAQSWAADHGLFGGGSGDVTEENVAQWGEYVQPGGENYREYKLILPDLHKPFSYTTHFPDDNIVAFLRVTDRLRTVEQVAHEDVAKEPMPESAFGGRVWRLRAILAYLHGDEGLRRDLIKTGAVERPKRFEGMPATGAGIRVLEEQNRREGQLMSAWHSFPISYEIAGREAGALSYDDLREALADDSTREAVATASAEGQRLVDAFELHAAAESAVRKEATVAWDAEVREQLAKLQIDWDNAQVAAASTVDTFTIDEAQSDLHQQAREKGYAPALTLDERAELQKTLDQSYNEVRSTWADLPHVSRERIVELTKQSEGSGWDTTADPAAIGRVFASTGNTKLLDGYPEFQRAVVGMWEATEARDAADSSIPDAPFKGDAWTSLILKRALVLAVEQGKGGLTWADGQTVVERWSERYRNAYEMQYDKKMPSIVAKLTGIKPQHFTMDGRPYPQVPKTDEEAEARRADYIAKEEALEAELRAMPGFPVDGTPQQQAAFVQATPAADAIRQRAMVLRAEGSAVASSRKPAGYWAIPITEELAAKVRNEAFPLFQREDGEASQPQGQIVIGADRAMAITLFESANLSTFFHESAHFFLEVMSDLAAREDAPQQVRDDFRAIQRFVGARTGEPFTTEQHERWARSFELYLRSGRAPAPELVKPFARFARWLTDLYRTIDDLLGRGAKRLDPEITGVMDRMLAIDEEIELMTQRQGMVPLLPKGESAKLGLTDAEWETYVGMLEAATEEARAEVTAKVLRAKNREREEAWRAEADAVREEITDALERTPAFRAWRILNGRVPAGDPVPEGVAGLRLDKAALAEAYTPEQLTVLRSLNSYRVEGGSHPDAVAGALGFDSGDALVRALLTVRGAQAAVEGEVAAEMRRRHPDPIEDGSLPELVTTALHRSKRVAVLEHELALLAKLAGQPAPNARALRAIADRAIARKTARTLRPNDFLVAERRAAREATAAAATGDFAKALQLKREQALQSALYGRARAAQETATRQIAALRKAASPASFERIGKAGKEYVDALAALMEGHELRAVSAKEVRRREALRNWIATMQEDNDETAVSEELLARVEREEVVNVADLNLTQLTELHDAVKNLLHLARLKNTLLSNRDKRTWEEARTDLLARIRQSLDEGKPLPFSDADLSLFGRLGDTYGTLMDWVLQPETVAEWLDGGETGPWHDYFWNQAETAQARREELQRKVAEPMQAILTEMPGKQRRALDRRVRIASLGRSMSRHTILSVALNLGSESNRDKLMRGGMMVDGVQVPFTDEQIAEMISHLSAADLAVVQRVWDATNLLWPDVVALQEDLTGLTPEKIEARQFTITTRDGPVSLRGGYFPAVYDPRASSGGVKQAQAQEEKLFSGGGFTKAVTSKGHIETRTEYAAPMLLDYHAVLSRHLGDVITDLSHRRYVKQAIRILSDTEIKGVIHQRLSSGAYHALLGSVRNAVVGGHSIAEPASKPVEKLRQGVMTNTAVAALGFKAALTIANLVSAPVQAAARVQVRYLLMGFGRYYANPLAQTRIIHELSPMMRARAEGHDTSFEEAIAGLRGKRGIRAKVATVSLAIHRTIVPLVERFVWMGRYMQATRNGSDRAEATRLADKAIRQTQTKHAPKDLSAAERDPRYKIFNLFLGPMVVINNRMQDAGLRGKLRGAVETAPEAFGTWLAMIGGGALVFELMSGRGPDDEDEDGVVGFDDWAWWAFKKAAIFPLQTIPLVRNAANLFDGPFSSARPDPVSEAMSALVIAGKTGFEAGMDWWEGEEVNTEKLAKDTTRAVGVGVGVPTSQALITGEYLWDVSTGEYTPDNPAEAAKYLIYRRPTDEQ